MEGTTSLEREIARLRDEIALSPRNLELKLKYGHACLVRDRRLEALRVYQEVLNEEENAQARLALAKIYYLQEYYPEAYIELRKLFNIDPVNLQGHVLLHLLKDQEPVPAELVQHLEFVPNRQFLKEQSGALFADRDLLDSQIAEYTAMVFGVTDPEPMAQYCVLEARKCKERLAKYIDKCKEWGRNTMDGMPFDLEDRESMEADEASGGVPAAQVEPVFVGTDASAEETPAVAEVGAGESEASAAGVKDGVESNEHVEAIDAVSLEPIGARASVDDAAVVADGDTSSEAPVDANAGSEENIPAADVELPEEVVETSETTAVVGKEIEEPAFDNSQFVALLETLCNNRNVQSAVLFQEDRGIVAKTGDTAVSGSTLLAVSECVKAWYELQETMNCWILEGSKGMVYIHRLNGGHILIIDSTSTNVGALRLGIGKVVPSLNELI